MKMKRVTAATTFSFFPPSLFSLTSSASKSRLAISTATERGVVEEAASATTGPVRLRCCCSCCGVVVIVRAERKRAKGDETLRV